MYLWNTTKQYPVKMLISNPKVSVIFCVFNVEKFIVRCARHAFCQTYQNIEFIFVDDGCQDNSIILAESVLNNEFPQLKHRVKFLHQKNSGLSAARLAGLKEATGDYVLFIDPDDWCKRQTVEKLVAAALKCNADMVVCNYYNAYRFIHVPRREKRFASKSETLKALFCHHHFRGYLWNKLVRKELYFAEGLYYPATAHCEDMVRTSQAIVHAHTITYIPDHLIYYNKTNPHSLSMNGFKRKTIDVVRNIMNLYLFYEAKDDSPFIGIEEPVLLRRASQILRSEAFELFDEYPMILEACSDTLRQLPKRELNDIMPKSLQRKTKRAFEAYLQMLDGQNRRNQ